MKPVFVIAFVALVAHGCTAAQLDQIDPVVYVPGVFCPDAHGTPQPLISGYLCCTDGNGGQCPEDEYCYGVDECRGPLPPNDGYGARRVTKRRGF